MRYKGQYKPSELLDPVSYEWYPLELCQPLLDQDKFFTFADMAIVERLKKFKIAPGTLDPGRLPEFDMAKIRLVTSQGWVYLVLSSRYYLLMTKLIGRNDWRYG